MNIGMQEEDHMVVGLVKEIKNNEFRVGLTPSCVKAYINDGHKVLVEKGAGEGSGFEDSEYIESGAEIISSAGEVWDSAEMIVKVKEPVEYEYKYLREDLILYTYLHLAADKPLTDVLLNNKVKAVAYETITDPAGGLPCLQPMSEIAGRLSVQEGAKYLERPFGGRGVLLGGVPGVQKADVVIIGAGAVGMNACKMAAGLGANVTILDLNAKRLAYIDDVFDGKINTLYSTGANIQSAIENADLVIGAVLLKGEAAPKLITRSQLSGMKKGAVIVDVAVDQGGCIETTRATTHQDPVFVVDDVVHYCVANMPGAVARTSTIALTSTTLPYGLKLAGMGFEAAVADDPALAEGVNCYDGMCTCKGVAKAFGLANHEICNLIDQDLTKSA